MPGKKLQFFLDEAASKNGYLGMGEVVEAAHDNVKYYEFYYAETEKTFKIESLTVYVQNLGLETERAYVTAPCFICAEVDGWKSKLKTALNESPFLVNKEWRIVFLDADEKVAIIEAMTVSDTADQATMESYRAFENSMGNIRIVKT
jgi:hypothetical protein